MIETNLFFSTQSQSNFEKKLKFKLDVFLLKDEESIESTSPLDFRNFCPHIQLSLLPESSSSAIQRKS